MGADDAIEASLQQLDGKLPRKDLAVRATNIGPDGTQHVRIDQLFHGIPVFEGEVITHVRPNGKIDTTDALKPVNMLLDTTPKTTLAEAIAVARGAGPTGGIIEIAANKLMVLPAGEHDPQDRLVWYVRLTSEGDTPAQWDTFVDAHTGHIALGFDTLTTEQAPTHGKTAWSGTVDLQADKSASNVYSLLDARGNTTCDMNNKTSGQCATFSTTNTETIDEPTGETDAEGNLVLDANGNPLTAPVTYGLFGNGTKDLTPRDTAGADAHHAMRMTLDYYQNVLGRSGIDGKGDVVTKPKSRVHYGSSYDNAFWQNTCYCMTYGDGSNFFPLTTLDVGGHEMSHGVMSKEANLTYRGESGGLNEANSDIFGTMVEWYAAEVAELAGDPVVDVPDWKIGERLYRSSPTKALRHMDDPTLDGKSPACWTNTIKRLDVHYSSGPANHMFYLLAQDPSTPTASKCTSATVTGIGRDKAAKVWYLAVANYMTSSTNYAGARVAAIAAANELAAADPAFADAPAAVAAAFSAIKVN